MNKLETRYRRLLLAYPVEHRQMREEEMVSVLLDVAHAGQRRPSLQQASAIVAAGLACRMQSATEWQAGLRIANVAALALGATMAVLAVGIALLPPVASRVESGPQVGPSSSWWVPTIAWTVALVVLAAVSWMRGRRSVASVSLVVTFALIFAFGGSQIAGFTRWYTVPFACFVLLSTAAVGVSLRAHVAAIASGAGFGGLLLLRFISTYGRYHQGGDSPVRLWEHVNRWSLSNDLVVIQPSHWLVIVVAGLILGVWRPRIAVAVGLLAVPLAILVGGPNAGWSRNPRIPVVAALPASVLLFVLAVGVGWSRRARTSESPITEPIPRP